MNTPTPTNSQHARSSSECVLPPTASAATDHGFRPHPSAEEVDFAYMTIKIFSDFGRLAGKPLSAEGVEALRPFWSRIQELVALGELSPALAQRCTHAAARAAKTLAAESPSLKGWHVSEAIRTVRAEARGLAGVLCR